LFYSDALWNFRNSSLTLSILSVFTKHTTNSSICLLLV
jgi:hypothetical protein